MTSAARNSDRSSRNSAKNTSRLSRKAEKRVSAKRAGKTAEAERTRDYVKRIGSIESPRNEERHKRTKHKKNQ